MFRNQLPEILLAMCLLALPAMAQEKIEIRPPEFSTPEPLPVATEQPAPAMAEKPAASVTDPQQVADAKPPSADTDSTNPISDITGNWTSSLMFNTSAMRELSEAIAKARRNKELGITDVPAPDGSGGVIPQKPEEPKEAPAFYLNSILYVSASEWVIWVNGTKVTPKEPMSDITIDSVNKQAVAMSWKAHDLNLISPHWQEEIKKNKSISVSSDNHTVKFTLFPNQTFVSRAMEIIEGKGVSSPIGVGSEQASQPDNAAPAGASGTTSGKGQPAMPDADSNMPAPRPPKTGAGMPSLPSAMAMPPMP